MKVDFVADERTAYNVLAETRSGNDANVVMAGAHLDSVQDGPGHQRQRLRQRGAAGDRDPDGQGQAGQHGPLRLVGRRGVRAAGLRALRGELTDEEADDIALYLNFDMVASPNYMFGVYDGDNSGGTAPAGLHPAGLGRRSRTSSSASTPSRGEPFQDSEFSGRSDYGPFIAVGIPAGGLFTGAEVPKTDGRGRPLRRRRGRGLRPLLPPFCDNLRGDGQNAALYAQLREDYELVGNINVDALDVNADAIATAVLTFAYDTSTVNAVAGKPGKSNGLYKNRASR